MKNLTLTPHLTTTLPRPRWGSHENTYSPYEQPMHSELDPEIIHNLDAVKAKQKATWESGDFGQIARSIENVAEEFMARLPLQPGSRLLDAACGTGNLAVLAARRGCVVSGIDIAGNLIAQART